MTRTCPHCGGELPRDPAQVAAHERHEQKPTRKAYKRDYARGKSHAKKGRPVEEPRETEDYRRDAYLQGYEAGS